MTVPFQQISSSRRIPLFVAEIGAGQGTPSDFVNPRIVLGQMATSGATAVAGTRYRITSGGRAAELFGRGSPAHLMCVAYLRNDPSGELYAAALGDAIGAMAASKTVTFGGSATEDGTLTFRIGGQLVEVGVTSGDDKTAVAAAFDAKVAALEDLPVTCATSGTDDEIATLTAKAKGTVGNLISLSLNALGAQANEVTPAGVTVTIAGTTTLATGGKFVLLASGATDPTAADWVTALAEDGYDVVAFQDTTSGALAALKTEMARRWEASSALDGVVFAAHADSLVDLETLTAARNDEFLTIASYKELVGVHTPAFEVAAAYAGLAARLLGNDPSANLQMKALVGVDGTAGNFTDTERDELAGKGCATLVSRAGTMYLEYEATTRFKNDYGEDDRTWEEIQTPFTLSRIRRRLKARIEARYSEHKLADDGSPIKSGQLIVTPQILKGEVIKEYESCGDDGLVEASPAALAAFKADLIIERDESNPSRVNGSISPDLINRFRVFAGLINFKT